MTGGRRMFDCKECVRPELGFSPSILISVNVALTSLCILFPEDITQEIIHIAAHGRSRGEVQDIGGLSCNPGNRHR